MNNCFNLIRLLAALQVLFVHSFNHFLVDGWFVSFLKMFPGVPIFFFISGLMIYGSYERNNSKGGLYTFYLSRFLRIYPGLWFCVILSIMSVFAVNYLKIQGVDWGHFFIWLVSQISFFQFYNPEFMRGYGVGVLNGALWTISVELQFYILAPLIFYLLTKNRNLIFGIFVISIASNVWVHNFTDATSLFSKLVRVSFIPWLFYFIFGFYIASLERLKEKVLSLPYLVIISLYVISMFVIVDTIQNSSNAINPISALLLVVLIYKIGVNENLSKIIFSRWANKTDLSYGIYLYHMPIINMFLYLGIFTTFWNITYTVITTIVMSLLSWHAIENPSLKLKKRLISARSLI